jgi:uncharacterized membrane protein
VKEKGAILMYDRKGFKQEAKQLMRASTPHFMLVALVYVLLTSGLNWLASALTGGNGLNFTLTIFLEILVWLFSMVMAVGFANYALRLARREETGMGSLFASFAYAGRSLGMTLLTALFTFLWSLIGFLIWAILLGVAAAVGSTAVAVTVGVVGYLLALAWAVIVSLRYVMAPFVLVDRPEVGAMESIRRSVRMMRGFKGKYFVLQLSFIGWEILVGLIAGVVTGIGVGVSGTSAVVQGLMMSGLDNPMVLYRSVAVLVSQLMVWVLLGQVLSLPLNLWLTVYEQTAFARFYNYVGGYDYDQYMSGNGGGGGNPSIPLTPHSQSDPQPPAGGYYNPVLPPDPQEKPSEPNAPEETTETDGTDDGEFVT